MTDFGKLAGNLNVGGAQVSVSVPPSRQNNTVLFNTLSLQANDVNWLGGIDFVLDVEGGLFDLFLIEGLFNYQNLGANQQFAKLTLEVQRLTDPSRPEDDSSYTTIQTTSVVMAGVAVDGGTFNMNGVLPVSIGDNMLRTGSQDYRFLVTTPPGLTGTQTIQGNSFVSATFVKI